MKKQVQLIALLFLSVLCLKAQIIPKSPQCRAVSFTLTAAGQTTSTFNNVQSGCTNWFYHYEVTGFSAISLVFESADGTVAPGAFGTFDGSTVAGSNPSTTTTKDSFKGTGYTGFYRMKLASASGTGSVVGILYGTSDETTADGSGGGATIPDVTNLLKGDGMGGVVDAGTNINIRQFGAHFDGQGSALSGTIVACQRVPWAGSITGWYVIADASGSATIGVKKVAFASYTGESGYSGYTDVTGGGTAPGLSSAVTATFSNLTSWSTSVTAGQVYCIQLSSPATAKKVDVYITGASS